MQSGAPATSPAARGFNPNIQGLRALAALLVLWHHLIQRAQDLGLMARDSPLAIGQAGQFGVDLFFLISGYLIVRSLRKRRGTWHFLKRRFIRIVPLLLVANTTVGLIHLRLEGASWHLLQMYVQSCLMLPGMFDISIMLPMAWSISYEETFYLSTALLFLLWSVHGRVVWPVALAWSCVLVAVHPRFIFFAAGTCALFYPRRVPWAPVWLVAFVALLQAALDGQDTLRFTLLDVNPVPALLVVVVGYLTFNSVVEGDSWFHRLLRSAPLQGVGLVSYSFYLWQEPVLEGVWDLGLWHGQLGYVFYGLASVVALSGVSWLSYRVVEQDSAAFLNARLFDDAAR